jgi:hypothetical protein
VLKIATFTKPQTVRGHAMATVQPDITDKRKKEQKCINYSSDNKQFWNNAILLLSVSVGVIFIIPDYKFGLTLLVRILS